MNNPVKLKFKETCVVRGYPQFVKNQEAFLPEKLAIQLAKRGIANIVIEQKNEPKKKKSEKNESSKPSSK